MSDYGLTGHDFQQVKVTAFSFLTVVKLGVIQFLMAELCIVALVIAKHGSEAGISIAVPRAVIVPGASGIADVVALSVLAALIISVLVVLLWIGQWLLLRVLPLTLLVRLA